MAQTGSLSPFRFPVITDTTVGVISSSRAAVHSWQRVSFSQIDVGAETSTSSWPRIPPMLAPLMGFKYGRDLSGDKKQVSHD